MWIESNSSPKVLTSKTTLFPFVAYKTGETVIFIPAADYSENQKCSNVVAVFSITEWLENGPSEASSLVCAWKSGFLSYLPTAWIVF